MFGCLHSRSILIYLDNIYFLGTLFSEITFTARFFREVSLMALYTLLYEPYPIFYTRRKVDI